MRSSAAEKAAEDYLKKRPGRPDRSLPELIGNKNPPRAEWRGRASQTSHEF
jgi:hypothetical protein